MLYLNRAQWGATAPLQGRMALPASNVYLHHSVTNPDDDSVYEATDDVARDMREIEKIGVQRFGIFSYSYCCHPSGVVAEGAGTSVGAHTANKNSNAFGFCLIGDYDNLHVADIQIQAFGEWWHQMVRMGLLKPDAGFFPHRKVKATACPGGHTMERWDDFYYATLNAPPTPPVAPDRLLPNQSLGPNQFIMSANGQYMLIYQVDGNLVVYDRALKPIWASRTPWGYPGNFIMQGDGNAVIYGQFGTAAWNTGTMGHPGAQCVLQNDGNLVIYGPGNKALWWSKR